MVSDDPFLKKNDEKVLLTLIKIYKLHKDSICDKKSTIIWIKTRDISDACGISIYGARYSLLKLCSIGLVEQRTSNKNKCCEWKPKE